MVDNFMYDVRRDEEFLIGRNPEQYHAYWWNDAEPLWITATKQVYITQGEVTSQNLWSRYDRHVVGIAWHDVWS